MTTHIQFHRSNIAGATPDVSYMSVGEPAVNLYDKKLWVKGISGDLITFIDGTTGERVAGSNTEIQFKDANGFSASGKLVFDGHGLSADGATFDNDIVVSKTISIGRGGGGLFGNISIGEDALKNNTTGSSNVGIGRLTLRDNTTGNLNTAIGYAALINNTTTSANTAIGNFTLADNVTGGDNTAVGNQTLYKNTDGSDNTAFGAQSLFKNVRGVKNTAIGKHSLYSNEHEVPPDPSRDTPNNYGDCNTAVGFESCYLGITANYNTGVGVRSLYNADGHSNTALGASAGFGIRTGSKNTALGASAGAEIARIDGSNNTFLGHSSEPSSLTVSNEITLGDTNVDTIRTGNDGFSISTTHGISAEGATFGGDVKVVNGSIGITGAGSTIGFADGSTQEVAAIQYYSVNSNETIYGANDDTIYSGFDITCDDSITILLQNPKVTNIPNKTIKYTFGTSNTVIPKLNVANTFTSNGGNLFTYPIGSNRYTWSQGSLGPVYASIDHASSTYMGITGGLINFKILGNHILDMDTDIHAYVGISADAGATFGGDVIIQGNLLLPDDGSVGIGGDTEKISFNGSGSGSSSIDIQGAVVDFGLGSGCELRSHGDTDTMLKFVNDHHGSGQDSLQLNQGGFVGVQVNPIDVNVAGATFHGGGATFSNTVLISGDLTHAGDTDTKLSFGTNSLTLTAGGTACVAVTGTKTNFADTEVERPRLKDYSETVKVIGTITGDTTVDFELGSVQTVTGNGDCEFDFDNWPGNGIAGTLTLIITNGGANATTWEDAVKWPGDNAPALTSSGVDIVSFMTIDAGTTVYGFVGGVNFS